jgi:signal transduction histidine kinase/ligand-binding sensor domain-containing protein
MNTARRALAGFALLLSALLWGSAADARGDPADPPLRGFKLRHWSLEEGAPSRINAIVQSHDGFLWLGGVDGLFRFDGVTFERIGPAPPGPNRIVVARLLAARDGAIWIGLARRRGMLVWRNGQLTDPGMPNPSREVNDIAEGPDGAIWISRGGRSNKALARWKDGRWTEFDATSGLPDKAVWQPFFASDGTLWLTIEDTVLRKRPGRARFEPTGIATAPRATLAEAGDGTIWLSDKQQTRAIARKGQVISDGPRFAAPFAIRTLFDQKGALWAVTWSDGAFMIEHPERITRTDPAVPMHVLNTGNGLLSDPVRALFEDREGNIWIGGEMGLNMLRRVPITAAEGIPADPAINHMLAADRDGTVYIADDRTVYLVAPGAEPMPALRSSVQIEAICAAQAGGVWIIQRGKAMRLDETRVVNNFAMPRDFLANSCGEDARGRVWLPSLAKGLFVLENGRTSHVPAVNGIDHLPGNVAIMPDGRAAVHFRGKPPSAARLPFLALADSTVPSDGVEGLLRGRRTLFTSGRAGLAAPLLPGSPLLSWRDYPWASSVNGMVQTNTGETWMIGDMGIVRMSSAGLDRALAKPGAPLAYRVFDFRDGMDSFVQKSPGAQIVAGKDGRIWFATRDSVLNIDPALIRTNIAAPLQIIRGIRIDSELLPGSGALPIAAGTTALAIDYTATGLAVPERVRFRYRLLGLGNKWIDAGTRRSANFSGLGPGDYRFELLAANEDEVWSAQPAALDFTIARAFYQTWWFRLALTIAIGALLYTLYALRLRQVSSRIRSRMLARTGERERIARELHDTMIQGVQGMILRFQAVADRFSDDPEAQAILQPALERAEEVLIEGRERVTQLRLPRQRDFHAELVRLLENPIYPQERIAPLHVAKTARPVSEGIIDDLLAVLGEAVGNAARHSHASHIEAGVRYGQWTFTAYVRDNGIGMHEEIVASGGKPGHFGLVGMRERIEAIGGKLIVESATGFGTIVRLQLPSRIAYAK